MIYCVRFDDFERFLHQQGFRRAGQTAGRYLYTRGPDFITVRKPSAAGALTLQEVDTVCDAADLKPPIFDTHWCD